MTLKGVPDELYVRLQESARAHRRSINSEAIVCLEKVLQPRLVTVSERLARARRLRAALDSSFRFDEIADLKRQGRP